MTQRPSFLPPPERPGAIMPMPAHSGYLRTPQDYNSGYSNYPNMAVADDGFDPLKLLSTLVFYRWLLATLLAATLILAVLFTWQQTPLYRGNATLELNGGTSRVIQDLEMTSDLNDIRTFETARQKLVSYDLARRVVFQLGLAENADFLAPTASFSLRNLVSRALGGFGKAAAIPEDPEAREMLAINTVRNNLSAELLRNTRLLSVSFSHADPQLSASVANQAARSFIDQAVDAKSDTSKLTREFIQEQVIAVKQKLELSEKALVDYAREAGITVTGTDATLIGQNISDVNASLAKAIDERLLAERQYTQVKEGTTGALPQVGESKSVQETKNKLIELQATYKEKSATLKPAFPEMRRLSAQISELKSQLNQEIAAIGRGVEIQFEQAKEKERGLREVLKDLESKQSDFQSKNIEYTILKRDVDSNRSQYDSLIGKLNDAGVGSDLKTASASVLDEAQVPTRPYSPRLGFNLAIALALFLAVSSVLIYVLELFNNTFAVPDQIESELKIPVLGIVPKAEATANFSELLEDERSPVSEAYRSLRTSLQFTGTDGHINTLLVTSSEPSEGKTTTAFKLAQDFAALGQNVLVIDCDLRRPAMHKMFKLENGIGLSNLLTNVGSNNVAGIFRQTKYPKITFMSAGTIPPNPSDLLVSQKMGLTLHYCAKKYDMVVVDAPPVMGLSDAPILARQADATLLVVSAKQVPRKAARQALKRLKASGANIVGAAMTKFALNQVGYDYAYRYMSTSYYTYGGGEGGARELEDHATGRTVASNDGRAGANGGGLLGRLLGRTGGNS
jgi:succinoglycan biosynthesis transport protein ExoP